MRADEENNQDNGLVLGTGVICQNSLTRTSTAASVAPHISLLLLLFPVPHARLNTPAFRCKVSERERTQRERERAGEMQTEKIFNKNLLGYCAPCVCLPLLIRLQLGQMICILFVEDG